MQPSARRFFVQGRVQGVGFRWFVERSAQQLGLRGFARNLADGRVEVYAIGSPEKLESLAALLANGPPHAAVGKVDSIEAAVEDRRDFKIF